MSKPDDSVMQDPEVTALFERMRKAEEDRKANMTPLEHAMEAAVNDASDKLEHLAESAMGHIDTIRECYFKGVGVEFKREHPDRSPEFYEGAVAAIGFVTNDAAIVPIELATFVAPLIAFPVLQTELDVAALFSQGINT